MPDAEIVKNALKYLVKLRIDNGEYGYAGDNPDDYVSWKYVLQILDLMPCDKVADYGLCGLCADQGGCGACVAETRKELEEEFGILFSDEIKNDEEESVLDKIRAEIIEKDRNVKAIRSDCCCFFTADEILNILNKYMVESDE